jgi:predicted nucleotidyltransferase
MRPSQILHMHSAEIHEILGRYPMLSNLRVFGSVARREDTDSSDIDLLVDPGPDATLFDMGSLNEDLEKLLCVSVHLISSRALQKEPAKTKILNEAVLV